jgi:tRNA(Ile)-lysidine synthase
LKRRAVLKTQKGGLKVSLDYNKISQPLFVRGMKPGDRFTPLGMKGTKKVSDFLTDAKVPGFLKDEIPVIADKRGIIWLVGHRIADRAKIDDNTGRILTIEFRGKRSDGNAQI